MAFYASGSGRAESCALRVLFSFVLVLGLAASGGGQAVPSGESRPPPAAPVTLSTLVTGSCEEVRRYVESIVGIHVIQSTFEFVNMLVRFLAEGAASGLNVIAVYVTEILRVTGVDVKLPFPHFTPEGVTSVAQWGLLALMGYWLLSLVLRLLLGVARQMFWTVKTVLSLWLFGLIVSDGGAAADTTAVRLGGLVLGCVLLGLVGPGSEKGATMENRLSTLEGRLKAVERRKNEE